jgi:hypothetical protein
MRLSRVVSGFESVDFYLDVGEEHKKWSLAAPFFCIGKL